MPELTYRAATPGDAAALAFLRWHMEVERHGTEHPRDEYMANFVAALRPEMERGTHQAWLAEAGGEPVACVILIWWAMPPNFEQPHRKRGFVSSVYTRPEYRRQGVARRLMELLIAGAREQGVQRLILWASDMGRPLYEGLGFISSRGMELNL
jgi:GNAT superfamily N-acetyltransferase